MKKMMVSKISFLGDLMCEKPFLKSAHRRRGNHFDGFLDPCKDLFSKSDLVVGNLETPCDPDSPLTKEMFVFNSPVSFVKAIRDSGIGFVTTATNHCLDRGLSGLKNTIGVLDELGMGHTGTFRDKQQERFEQVVLPNGTRIAILSYTYGTNYMDNNEKIDPEDFYSVNYLTPLFEGRNNTYNEMSRSLWARIRRMIPREIRIRINSRIGRPNSIAYTDKIFEGDICVSNQIKISNTIESAKKAADLVVVCPHFGGQFNIQHGTYVDAFVELFDKNNVDVVIGNHPHVVQDYSKMQSGMRVAYSLGNVSISLSTPYIVLDDLPDCSVMLHIYTRDQKIVKMSFSVLIEREEKGFITVYPLYKLYNESEEELRKELIRKNKIICSRFLNRNEADISIQEEYTIEL